VRVMILCNTDCSASSVGSGTSTNCFMALVLHRVMRQRLKLAGSPLSPEAALQQLRRVQRHSVRIDGAEPIAGISTIGHEQAATLEALKVSKPSQNTQMSLL